MKRRDFIRNMSASAAGLAVSSAVLPNAKAQPDAPNVLFIFLEDAPNWFGCMGGHPDTLTPNIDQLVSRGTLFTNAHCGSPICNPSRTSMLTGRRPDSTGVYYNEDDWREFVSDDVITMPRHFRDRGYNLVRSGKVFHGNFDEREVWHQFYDGKSTHKLAGHDPYNPMKPWNGLNYVMEGQEFFNWGATDAPEATMADFKRVRFLNDLLDNSVREPFMMYYGTTKSHLPSIAPRRVMERFNPAEVTLPPINPNDHDDLPPPAFNWIDPNNHTDVVGAKQWRKMIAAYLATIYYVDEMVGRLLYAFDNSQHADNTIIALVADHGFHLGEKMHWRKATLWNESTQVIMSVIAPGVTSPNTVCHQAVSMLDLYPTLSDLCGLPMPPGLEGQTLVPQLINPAAERPEPAICTLEAGNHAVVNEQYHLINYSTGDQELYDMAVDPNQWNNIAGDPAYAAVIADLMQWIPEQTLGDATTR
jgi:arylsulfatase A-like enzyme